MYDDDKKWLALNLEGPLQSWGLNSEYNIRNSELMPTKSAIAGMCAAAIGISKKTKEGQEFYFNFLDVKMMSISIPKIIKNKTLNVKRLQDFHIVQNSRQSDGNLKTSHITYRQFISDINFGILLYGDKQIIQKIFSAIQDPKWGIWLGRKTCIPSSPVGIGIYNSKEEALFSLIEDQPLDSFTIQEEVDNFSDGTDSLPDQVNPFKERCFALRRIRKVQGIMSTTARLKI